jgi:adenylosuccinate lyase
MYIGRCPQQVEEFIRDCVNPALAPFADLLTDKQVELKV